MNHDEEYIKQILSQRNEHKAELNYLQAMIKINKSLTPEQNWRMQALNEWISSVDSLLMILNEDEMFIIQRHILDGIDWNRIVTEYAIKWGDENLKCRRTLIRCQKAALKKLAKGMKIISIPEV